MIDLYVIYHYVRRNIDFSIFLMIFLGVGAIQIYIDIHEISLAIHGCMEFLQRLWIHMENVQFPACERTGHQAHGNFLVKLEPGVKDWWFISRLVLHNGG